MICFSAEKCVLGFLTLLIICRQLERYVLTLKLLHLFAFQDSYSYVRSTATAVAYDSKQYYQQPTATAAVAAAHPQPSVADSYYQTGMTFTPFKHHLLRPKLPSWTSVKICLVVYFCTVKFPFTIPQLLFSDLHTVKSTPIWTLTQNLIFF